MTPDSTLAPAWLDPILARLTTDQRVAATAPPGPVLCVAPAGSGKTTTLVARIAWLIGTGMAAPECVAAITFNKRAAEELGERLDAAIAPLGVAPRTVRVRTFHALGREILRDAGAPIEPLVDRAALIGELWPDATAAEIGRLDTAFSRLKLDLGVTAADIAADPGAGRIARAFVRYEAAIAERGGVDFDDLVRGALDALEDDPGELAVWRDRCGHLLVDEVQDVDRSQLQLALRLAAPANRIFLVGDDDQSIYGWRLADVRRVLAIDAALPGLRRVDLQVNHRCPVPVVERAVRLIEHNRERFAKVVRPRPDAPGSLVLAPDDTDEPARTERLLRSWLEDGTCAILARTNRELRPAVLAALALGEPFRAPSVDLLVDDPILDGLLVRVDAETDSRLPLLVRLARFRRIVTADGTEAEREGATALLAWAPPYPDVPSLVGAIEAMRALLAELRRDDARLSLATAHSTKGAEFDHVAVVGMEEGRFPSGRTIAESEEPDRAMEEERRLGYVAWTRARRTLTLSYDPAVPSPFLLEAFSRDELGLEDESGS